MSNYSVDLPEKFVYTSNYRVQADDVNFANHLAAVQVLPIAIRAHSGLLENVGLDPENSDFGLIMASSHIDYVAESYLDDELKIDLAVDFISAKSFDLIVKVVDAQNQQEVARIKTRMLFYDYIMSKVVDTPLEFVEGVKRLSQRWAA